jgi:hypothetical protein
MQPSSATAKVNQDAMNGRPCDSYLEKYGKPQLDIISQLAPAEEANLLCWSRLEGDVGTIPLSVPYLFLVPNLPY